MTDKMMRIAGRNPSGHPRPMQVDEDNNLKVIQAGRNIEVVKFFDELAITDTAVHSSLMIDVTKYKKITWVAYTTLDQAVRIFPQFGEGLNPFVIRNNAWEPINDSIPLLEPTGHDARRIINPAIPELDRPMHSIRWVAGCSVAPTSGTLTIEAWGLPN